ncbi:MAG: SGNH/GDSL hydrolase family protein [Pseudomonadota bacterium]
MIARTRFLQPPTGSAMRLIRNLLLGALIFLAVDRGGDAALRFGLDRYFGLDTPGALLLVGHSHVVLGVSEPQLETALGREVAKYARAGAALEDRILAVSHYLERQPEGPVAVIFGVDGHIFAPRGLSANSYRLFYPYLGTPAVAAFIKARALSTTEVPVRRLSRLARYNDVLLNAARRGLTGNTQSAITGQFDPDVLVARAALGDVRPLAIDQGQVATFERFLSDMAARDIPVILAFIPTTDTWNALQPDIFADVLDRLQSYGATQRGVAFVSLLDEFAHDHTLFADPIHLNVAGQRRVTARLADALAPLLPPLAEKALP